MRETERILAKTIVPRQTKLCPLLLQATTGMCQCKQLHIWRDSQACFTIHKTDFAGHRQATEKDLEFIRYIFITEWAARDYCKVPLTSKFSQFPKRSYDRLHCKCYASVRAQYSKCRTFAVTEYTSAEDFPEKSNRFFVPHFAWAITFDTSMTKYDTGNILRQGTIQTSLSACNMFNIKTSLMA